MVCLACADQNPCAYTNSGAISLIAVLRVSVCVCATAARSIDLSTTVAAAAFMVLVLAALYTLSQYEKTEWAQQLQRAVSCGQNMDEETKFDPSVKTEWIEAVFPDESHMVPYDIPPSEEKVGLTIARLALGCVVRSVDKEAKMAGVEPQSLLVAINGLPLLGEPTELALQRIWHWEWKGPVRLDLLRHGKPYSVTLLTNPPWGILWGPCGNFPLVKRVYGQAAAAGVPRGCLVASVNGLSFRQADHAAMALQLSQANATGRPIQLMGCVAPATTRPPVAPTPTSPTPHTRTLDNVQVKFHSPLDSLCHAGGMPATKSALQEMSQKAALGMPVPEPNKPLELLLNAFGPAPKLESLLKHWTSLEALVFVVLMDGSDYVEPAVPLDLAALQRHCSQPHIIPEAYLLHFISVICTDVEAAPELTSILLSLARKHEGFGQRLYFLLRSYISSLERTKPQNLLALMNCLELLRSAEKELATYSLSSSPRRRRIDEEIVDKSCLTDKRGVLKFLRKKKSTTAAAPVRMVEIETMTQSPSAMYDNMSEFLGRLDVICSNVERSLQKSFRQKIRDWALSPWSPSKDSALQQVTQDARTALRETPIQNLVNPVDSTEILSAVDVDECYVLPSCHCPLLLSFLVHDGNWCHYHVSVTVQDSQDYMIFGSMSGAMDSVKRNRLELECQSCCGPPRTLTLRCERKDFIGYCWIDVSPFWNGTFTCKTPICHPNDLNDEGQLTQTRGDVTLEISLSMVPLESNKRMLLYKHDDDIRQELFAVEFIRNCDRLLRANGLDLELLTFSCIPVGTKRGFVEWVPGSVPLSEIVSNERKYNSMRQLPSGDSGNPIQDYLRSVAFDKDAPYLIRPSVLDTYIKSCAGYCVITYTLGVGDRHLDNILLHQDGHFFHCDYSFLFGRDPKMKKSMMRITPEMVAGMGGEDCYQKFLANVGASFLALRREVRVLLSLVRCVEEDETVILEMRDRLQLHLSEPDAVAFIEDLVESSCQSKVWLAVDAIHSMGKKF